MGIWSTIAGVADHAAGSTDEAVGRQFDDVKGGGAADMLGGDFLGDVFMTKPDSWAGTDSVQVFDGPLGQSIAEVFAGETGSDVGGDVDPEKTKDTPAKVIADFLSWIQDNFRIAAYGAGALLVIYTLGNLFNINVGDSTS